MHALKIPVAVGRSQGFGGELHQPYLFHEPELLRGANYTTPRGYHSLAPEPGGGSLHGPADQPVVQSFSKLDKRVITRDPQHQIIYCVVCFRGTFYFRTKRSG